MIHLNFLPVSSPWFWAILLTVVSVAACYSYLSMRVELRLLKRRSLTRAEFDARWAEVITELESLRSQVKTGDTEVRPAPGLDWSGSDRTPNAMNLNRRGQILRLHGKGRSPAEIASDLQISQGEVELMLKVHDWSPVTPL